MKKIYLFFSLLATVITASAQQQVFELMERTDLSIHEIEIRANRYFDSAGTGRGTGYKQFQRWLYERKFHTDENGYFISPQKEWNNYLQSRSNMEPNAIAAANWIPLGPSGWTYTSGWNPGTGRLSAIAIHPANENIIYVGSPGGGLWKSTNAGANWVPLTDNNSLWMSVFAITIDPVDQNIIYVGTSNSILLKSTNGGSSFTATGAGPSGTIRKILIHPASTNIVFATATNGIWRSVNAGASWTQVHAVSKEDIEFKPNDANIMYASGNDVVRSADNGVTWTTLGAAQGITNSGRTLVSVSAADPNIVYAVQASGSLFGRMYRSTDAGLNFTTTVVGNPASGTNYFGYLPDGTGTTGQATYDMGMDVSPTNANDVYIAGIICWRSVNGGTSFTALTVWSYPNGIGYNHADVHGLFWINSTIYSISDGGIYKSIDNGDNWTDLSPGLTIRQFYRIANSQTNANVITGGAQDNGSVTRQASGNWADWLGADGMEGLVSPTNHLNLWGTSQGGAIYRSTNGGNSYSGLSQPSAGQWVTPLAIHPTNETILYGGWTGVYKSTNSGVNWTNLSAGTITTTLADLAVAPSDPNYIYASNGATLYVTTNEGLTWAIRTAPAAINDIAVDATNPSKIWIACNSSSNQIMVSTDAGATFSNISSNLPAIAARTVVVDDNTPRGIYAGMNIGVYYKTEPDINWSDFSANLPLVAINELEIQKASGKIRVATYGRSVWESPVATQSGFTLSAPAPAPAACPAPATMQTTITAAYNGGFVNNITLSASGNPPGTTVVFGTNPLTTVNPSSTVILTGTNNLPFGSYTITVTGVASGAPNQTQNITYTINPGTGPTINTHPASQAICQGGTVTFTVAATGATSYQWQKSTDGGVTWPPIAGATGTSYTIVNIQPTDAAQYRCVAFSQCGSTNSNAATLTVNTPPVITAHPQSVTLCTGATNTFSVTATGTGLIYAWEYAINCSGPWLNVVGASSPTLTVTAVSTNAYRCLVSGTCSPMAVSNSACMTVVNSVTITTQPSNATVCEGSNTSFTAAGSGTGLTYQWQLSINGGANWGDISGATNATHDITGATFAMNNYQYRCVISNGVCPTPGITNAAVLMVNRLAAITSQPTDVTLCSGSSNTFCVTAIGTNLTYQWQASVPGCGGPWTNIAGATSNCLTITGIITTSYRCMVTSTTCSNTVTSNCATFTVINPVTISAQPSNVEICSGSNASFTVAGNSVQPINYQWQVSTDGGANWNAVSNAAPYSGATTATLTITGTTTSLNGNRYRCQLSNATCTVPTVSNAGILTVRQLPTIGLTAAPLTALLPGQTTTLTATPSASTGGSIGLSWLFNSNLLPVPGNTYVVNVENVGSYYVFIQEIWPGLTCSNRSPTVTIDASASPKLFIFPSPNDGTFKVAYYNDGGASTQRTIAIFDSKGSLVYNSQINISGAYTLIGIDLQRANTGIYYVVIGDANGKKLAEGKVHVK